MVMTDETRAEFRAVKTNCLFIERATLESAPHALELGDALSSLTPFTFWGWIMQSTHNTFDKPSCCHQQ